jgi:hypothetical protein
MAERTWGLIALSRSGQVGLDLDESSDDGPLTYMLTLSLPFAEMRFKITGVAVAQALNRFVSEHYGRTEFAEFQLGDLDGLSVQLIKDDEHPDRFFIRAAGEGMIDVTLVDPIASDFVHAAADLADKATCR